MKKGITGVLSAVAGGVAGGLAVSARSSKEIKKWCGLAGKHLEMVKLYDQWFATKQEGKSVADYLKGEGIKTAAIYGMSFMGQRLYEELKDSGIEIRYGIDKNQDKICADIDIVTPEDDLEEVDVIIVTAFCFFDEIEDFLMGKTDSRILSLEDLIYML
ncbi:MAG: hypothetical protein HDR17_13255 [Lachnospiraceae bacterium]|nr:hypothetical protein [Lachnospiraceae bacterium]